MARLPFLLLLVGAPALHAQVFHGTVRTLRTARPIAEAQVTVRDTTGDVMASALSDSAGRFTIRLRRPPAGPVYVQGRRLGYEVVRTGEARPGRRDSVEVELLMTEIPAPLEPVAVLGRESLNERRLADAYRRGWQVMEPERVAQLRDRAPDFIQFLRSLGTVSLLLPQQPDGCVRDGRTGRCLTWVLDGQVLGPSATILPSEVYFFAILSPTEARLEYGSRAPDGAIAVFTRSASDPVRRPR